MTSPDPGSSCSCKVGRTIETYDLADLDEDLVEQRQRAEASLRDLADCVNRRILAAALQAADADVTDDLYGAVSDDDALGALYEALASDDTPTERTARVRTKLAQQGVDVDAVEADWVTHPTVRTHLRECLNVETGRTASITPEDARNTNEWARTRCENVVDQTFTRLRNADVLDTGDLDVTVTVQVTCSECGATYRPGELLDRRECGCPDPEESTD